MPRIPTVAAAVILLAIACSDPTATPVLPHLEMAKVSAEVLTAEADAGAMVDVRFVNTGEALWFVGTCQRTVEQYLNARWTVLPPELRLCAGDGILLRSQDILVRETDVPLDVPPGTYRFRFALELLDPDGRPLTDEGLIETVSNAFTVR
jgi:hypothetical protein